MVKEVNKVNRVIVVRTTLHKFIENNGQDKLLSCISYKPTQIDASPLSPQTYHKMHGGYFAVHGNKVTMNLPFHRIHIPVDLGGTKLPVVHN